MADAITLQEITKQFGRFTAVDRLDLRVGAGEVLGFLGPNGAGKTTTLRMVMGILFPDSGVMEVLGHARALDVKDRIGYLPEERGLYRKMTALETLKYFGKLKGMSGAPLTRACHAALERVGLAEWTNKKVEALSKGMSQKLQFVSTILHQPELVILDEPFSGLDPINAEALKQMLADLRSAGTTVIFSTHQMEQAERLCDRIVLINRGQKLIDGAVSEIRERYSTRVVEIEGNGDLEQLRSLDGVARETVTSGTARLELADGTEPSELLQRALEHVRVTRYEVMRPSLEDIFVRLVMRGAVATNGGDA